MSLLRADEKEVPESCHRLNCVRELQQGPQAVRGMHVQKLQDKYCG